MKIRGEVGRLSRVFIGLCILATFGGWLGFRLLGTYSVSKHSTHSITTPSVQGVHATSPPEKTLPPMSLTPSEPQKLRIAKLAIEASVTKVGLTKNKEMEAPEGAGDIGWYRYGYLPGSLGNAVMAAHNWHQEGKGIFFRLDELTGGDEFEVVTKTSNQVYKVTDKKVYSDSASADEVFAPSDKARLNLITCAGDWQAAKRRYTHRLVIFSEFVREDQIAQ